MTIINGHTIGQFQRCKRPIIISKTHTLNKWRPQSLLAACLRSAIYRMSNGEDKDKSTAVAINNFLANAKNPGLDIMGVDTYTLAQDYCAIIRNVLEYLSRLPLLTLKDIPNLSLSPTVFWQFLSHTDETGTLHRWEIVDYLEDDPISELHSWEVFGDVAAADAPMILHLLAIGQRKGCHQNSPWCRIYSHSHLPVKKFQKVKGGALKGDWKPTWFAGNSKNESKDWVDLMIKENVIGNILQHINVKEVSAEHQKLFKRDALLEASSMASLPSDPRALPLSRYACDHPYTCPHQLYCYTNSALDDVGIYARREKKDDAKTKTLVC